MLLLSLTILGGAGSSFWASSWYLFSELLVNKIVDFLELFSRIQHAKLNLGLGKSSGPITCSLFNKQIFFLD